MHDFAFLKCCQEVKIVETNCAINQAATAKPRLDLYSLLNVAVIEAELFHTTFPVATVKLDDKKVSELKC